MIRRELRHQMRRKETRKENRRLKIMRMLHILPPKDSEGKRWIALRYPTRQKTARRVNRGPKKK